MLKPTEAGRQVDAAAPKTMPSCADYRKNSVLRFARLSIIRRSGKRHGRIQSPRTDVQGQSAIRDSPEEDAGDSRRSIVRRRDGHSKNGWAETTRRPAHRSRGGEIG